MRYFVLFFSMFSFLSTAQADNIYKHTIPFTIQMAKDDILTVYYDFSAKSGIHCTALGAVYKINFTYKGHQKSALLPITLQNRHVPAKKNEVLADISGEFKLEMTELYPQAVAEISCEYLNVN